jgi:transposase-like protein
VCDDNYNLKTAARERFPAVRIQTCYNHFKENIRRDLKVGSEGKEKYRDFMRRIESILDSSQKLSDETFNRWMFTLLRDYRQDPLCLSILINIDHYKGELLAYRGIPSAPLTTNLIEGMNKHIESRLTALNAFQSVAHAKLWFNGYILKRRYTKFTDTRGKFKHLRGTRGVDQTKKERVTLPLYF